MPEQIYSIDTGGLSDLRLVRMRTDAAQQKDILQTYTTVFRLYTARIKILYISI